LKIGVIIPAYNEAETIFHVIKSVPRLIDNKHPVTVIVIDDGSSDLTSETAVRAQADMILSHDKNSGVGAAIKTGLTKAIELGADIVCTLDADGQLNPKELPRVVSPILHNQASVVIGSRFSSIFNSSVPISNRIMNKLMALILSLILFKRYTDVCSGYRALHSGVFHSLKIDDSWDTYGLLLDITLSGYRTCEVPISVRYFRNRKSRVVSSFGSFATSVVIAILRRFIVSILPTRLGNESDTD